MVKFVVRLSKIIRISLVLLFVNATGLLAQTIATGPVDAGPYGKGSTIAVPLTIEDSQGKLLSDNVFKLYLSDATGSFAAEKEIGSYKGFYSTFVNGLIPANTAPGNYKVRIKSSKPAVVSAPSNEFKIENSAGIVAGIDAPTQTISTNPKTFGNCTSGRPNLRFNFNNASTAGAVVTATFTNGFNEADVKKLTFNGATTEQFTAAVTHYTIFVKAESNGIIGTQAYFLINNTQNTPFSTFGSNTVCLPLGVLEYGVEINGASGIHSNFPGYSYRIKWGDNTIENYTINQIRANNGRVQHTYIKSSCGSQITAGSQKYYNVFGIEIQLMSPFCNEIGTPVSTQAKVVTQPENRFAPPEFACINTPLTISNNSIAGENPSSATPACTNNNVVYYWYVDNVLITPQGVPLSYQPKHTFTTPGVHTIRLESESTSDCQAAPVEKKIKVQMPPKPAFILNEGAVCVSSVLAPVNTSVVDTAGGAKNTYQWIITGPSTPIYVNGTSAASEKPQFKFSKAGVYKVKLTITSSCTPVTSPEQTIIVNEEPVITANWQSNLCGKGQLLRFSNTQGNPVTTSFSGTYKEEADTYLWEISGGAFSFKEETTANSKEPVIFFEDYGTYTIKITSRNNCGVKTLTKTLTFSESPTVNAGADLIICAGNSARLNGTLSGPPVAGFSWVGGTGTFIPGRNSLNVEYLPSAAEIKAGTVQLSLTATTLIPAPCDKVVDVVVVTINPPNKIISGNSAVICTGTELNYQPIAVVEGSTISWTATGSANARGFSASGTGNIKETLSNVDAATNATVTYTIIPEANGCPGEAFTYTVTINPVPSVQAKALNEMICTGQAAGISLSSPVPGMLYTWTAEANGAVTGYKNQNTPISNASIADILVNTGTTTGTVTYTITPVNGTGCSGEPVRVVVNVTPPAVVADAGADQKLCTVTAVKLNANHAGLGTGKWTLVSGQTGVSFDSDSKPDAMISGLVSGQVYRFRWTITGPGTCNSSNDEVLINNLTALAGNTISYPGFMVCEGTTVTITGSTPVGGDGTYTYKWEASTDGSAWTAINVNNQKNLSVIVTENTFFRRTVSSGDCSIMSGMVKVDVQKGITNNTITGTNLLICVNTVPAKLEGSVPAGADGTYKYQWQQSNDGKTWSNIIAATGIEYQPQAISKLTYFRRVVTSTICTGAQQSVSNVVEVKVSNGAVAAFTWTSESACAPFNISAQNIKAQASGTGDTYQWFAGNKLIGTGITFPGYTLSNPGDVIEITLKVTSALGCGEKTFSHTFKTNSSITAQFTADKLQGCGTTIVNFNNQTLNPEGVNFEWTFGNGQRSTLKTPSAITFQARTDGKDTTYAVILKASSACATSSDTLPIKVIGQPVPRFTLSTVEGCSPLKVTFKNLTPGGSNTYTWNFGDGTPDEVYTDNRSVVHTYTTGKSRNFTVTMTVKNACGEKSQSHTIKVAPNTVQPDLVVNADQLSGCAPHTVKFFNYTVGATRYAYVFEDGSDTLRTISDDPIEHTFTKGGTYLVKLIASNCSDTVVVKKITVFPAAATAFSADVTEGCAPLNVKFTNTTTTAISYFWDFGNGSTYNGQHPPKQVFTSAKSSYTVKLITKSNYGCMDTLVMKDYIKVSSAPVIAFEVQPGEVIQYPNYKFTFKNTSTGDISSMSWDFGDGSPVSNSQNPEHSYPDTGSYNVKLIMASKFGCSSYVEKTVRITGTPGQLYVPNAFMPNSATTELRNFTAKGSGINKWHFRIFNKWGEMVWQTEKLDGNGAPGEAWDGTFNGKPAPQGVYFWEISASFKNGTEWAGMSYNNQEPKKTGPIHLIR